MLGPDGTAFGRGWIDIRLAVADSLEEMGNALRKIEFLYKVVSAMTDSAAFRVVVDTADGERKPASGHKWICP